MTRPQALKLPLSEESDIFNLVAKESRISCPTLCLVRGYGMLPRPATYNFGVGVGLDIPRGLVEVDK